MRERPFAEGKRLCFHHVQVELHFLGRRRFTVVKGDGANHKVIATAGRGLGVRLQSQRRLILAGRNDDLGRRSRL